MIHLRSNSILLHMLLFTLLSGCDWTCNEEETPVPNRNTSYSNFLQAYITQPNGDSVLFNRTARYKFKHHDNQMDTIVITAGNEDYYIEFELYADDLTAISQDTFDIDYSETEYSSQVTYYNINEGIFYTPIMYAYDDIVIDSIAPTTYKGLTGTFDCRVENTQEWLRLKHGLIYRKLDM
ncbi:MAG: hypothetical protein JXR19_03270 [Bacteroidia bacterium]